MFALFCCVVDAVGLLGESEVFGSCIQASTSADPDFDVDARLPCLAISSSEEHRILLAVLMLKVLW